LDAIDAGVTAAAAGSWNYSLYIGCREKKNWHQVVHNSLII
jgi:hypothetical protein